MTMKALLRIEGLHKRFVLHTQGGVELDVLRGIDLVVRPGECVVLAGPSGAGKSTLLRCVYGNYRADAGRILVRHGADDIDIVTAHHRAILDLRRRSIGYVSQFLRVVPRVPALDVVAEPLRALDVETEAARQRAQAILDALGIPQRLWGLAPQTFSGGEQQRVNIARGFVVGRPLMLLDEPTSALDPENRRRVVALIETAKSRGTAIVGVFHDPDLAEAVGTRRIDIRAAESPRAALVAG
jgi:alpha-D-ribose 1-methylphosphonate 5-triphosphate synthase subunit PhnL